MTPTAPHAGGPPFVPDDDLRKWLAEDCSGFPPDLRQVLVSLVNEVLCRRECAVEYRKANAALARRAEHLARLLGKALTPSAN